MPEQEEHIQEESTKEERSLAVNFLQEALKALGLGSGLTDDDLDIVVKPLVAAEGFYVGNHYLEQIAWLDELARRREAAKERCPTCGIYPYEGTIL